MTTDHLQLTAACRACADACIRTTMNECWDRNTDHAVHYRLLSDCAELCDLTARLIECNSPTRRAVAAACADVCAAAAVTCTVLEIDDCELACRACAEALTGSPAVPVYTLPVAMAQTAHVT